MIRRIPTALLHLARDVVKAFLCAPSEPIPYTVVERTPLFDAVWNEAVQRNADEREGMGFDEFDRDEWTLEQRARKRETEGSS